MLIPTKSSPDDPAEGGTTIQILCSRNGTLIKIGSNTVIWGGNTLYFNGIPQPGNSYNPATGNLITSGGMQYTFDQETGALKSTTDPNGRQTFINYTPLNTALLCKDQPQSVTDAYGNQYIMSNTISSEISSVETPDGSKVELLIGKNLILIM